MSSVVLETDRTILRPFEPADALAFGVPMRDSNITETTMFGAPARTNEEGVEQAMERIIDFSKHWSRYGFGIFGAFDRCSGAMIGYCGLRHLDEFDGDIHISTMVDRPYWLAGVALEIFRRNLEYVFLERGFEAVHGTARTYQMASVRLMERNGFIRQADRTLRDWPVFYYKCPREAFLARHVVYLRECLAELKPASPASPFINQPPVEEAAEAVEVSAGR